MARQKTAQTAQLSFGIIITDPDAHRIQSMRQTRKCLSCDGDFDSTHAGNRICGSCKQLSSWSGPLEVAVHASF